MRLLLLLCVIGVAIAAPADSTQYDVIVVGLGSAGTTAATELARAGRRVLALEAQARVGGRVFTAPFGDGSVEIGAEWIHGNQSSVSYELATQHNVDLRLQPLAIDAFRSDGTAGDSALVEELYELDLLAEPPNPPEAYGVYATKKYMEYITKNKPDLLKDQDFITEFLEFSNLLTNNLEASNDWNDVTTGGFYESLDGPHAISWHRHGYKTFFEILLNTYKGGPGLPNLDVKLNTEVTHITVPQQSTEKVTVRGRKLRTHPLYQTKTCFQVNSRDGSLFPTYLLYSLVTVTCKDGSTYTADSAIVTVSLGVLKATHSSLFSPPLPEDKRTAIEKISIGVVGKVILAFEEAWWPKNITLFGFIWKGEDRKNVPAADYWTTRIFGAHPPMGSSNTLTLWTSGNVAKEVETLPEDTVKTKCVQLLQRFIGDTLKVTVPQPKAMLRSTWYSNPYTRGSYSFDNLQAPQYPHARDWLASPIEDSAGAPRVLFAGEATNTKHFSTVHGASETGHREALRLLRNTS